MPSLGSDGRPEAEGTVHVDPRAGVASRGADISGRIEGARVDVARLDTDNRPIVERRQITCTDASLIIDRHPGDA